MSTDVVRGFEIFEPPYVGPRVIDATSLMSYQFPNEKNGMFMAISNPRTRLSVVTWALTNFNTRDPDDKLGLRRVHQLDRNPIEYLWHIGEVECNLVVDSKMVKFGSKVLDCMLQKPVGASHQKWDTKNCEKTFSASYRTLFLGFSETRKRAVFV